MHMKRPARGKPLFSGCRSRGKREPKITGVWEYGVPRNGVPASKSRAGCPSWGAAIGEEADRSISISRSHDHATPLLARAFMSHARDRCRWSPARSLEDLAARRTTLPRTATIPADHAGERNVVARAAGCDLGPTALVAAAFAKMAPNRDRANAPHGVRQSPTKTALMEVAGQHRPSFPPKGWRFNRSAISRGKEEWRRRRTEFVRRVAGNAQRASAERAKTTAGLRAPGMEKYAVAARGGFFSQP